MFARGGARLGCPGVLIAQALGLDLLRALPGRFAAAIRLDQVSLICICRAVSSYPSDDGLPILELVAWR